MAKFTPGPWRVYGLEIVSEKRPSICLMHLQFGRFPNDDPETMANARLIARSPSMLALLEKAYPIIEEEAARRGIMEYAKDDAGDYFTEMRDLANEVQAEIKKARGKEVKDV
jgi:hypothetical protein